jgi:hypothetical protein
LAAVLVDQQVKLSVLFDLLFGLAGQFLRLLSLLLLGRRILRLLLGDDLPLLGIFPILLLFSQIFSRDFGLPIVANLLAGVFWQGLHLGVCCCSHKLWLLAAFYRSRGRLAARIFVPGNRGYFGPKFTLNIVSLSNSIYVPVS